MTLGVHPVMSVEEFRAFRRLLADAAGLAFEDGARERLERRLLERLEATASRDFTDYLLKVSRGPAPNPELERMLEMCVTHETYFFREPRQLRALEHEIVPNLVEYGRRVGRRRLRIWSAGCSTGEEVYTLAIVLMRQPQLAGWDLEVLGTDLSQRALQRARRAVYGHSSFRETEPAVLDRYFSRIGTDQWEVRREVRDLCTWGRLNLWNSGDLAAVGYMDVVLCRNVLIYFDRDGKRRVIEALFDRLRPGGWLLLGHSESLLQVPTRFEAVSLANDLVYRRAPLTPDTPPRHGGPVR
ncbi:MAG: protein-glutamate O-methyltransferase CheR [Deltaproteobacteria bacterium]|nr:protein-glutamate O-methyltransferase CheR [Deltaproteobacteria bacterium]